VGLDGMMVWQAACTLPMHLVGLHVWMTTTFPSFVLCYHVEHQPDQHPAQPHPLRGSVI
jgi:hypothetical protein